ncbi:histone deacetylase family protein [Altibacter sp. HG106]|uniref:histone deacetylase family protein n=1 Tax=Altibacter sp. HG106 TaxID=3023937 RepID=UPI0023507D37|nr:histone deacetylase [Altibacter sp. HG106]MDC7994826.1 histone deacetylase [Altibacter sp. HG106]
MLKIAYHPIFKHNLPLGHRFPMSKYELLHQQLLYEGTCEETNFFTPGAPDETAVLAVHTKEYVRSLKELTLERRAARKIGFPLSEKLVSREFIITQGTVEGCSYALDHGIAMNIAGGTHHAYPDRGEAFCLFNDQAIGARWLLSHTAVKKIAIIDLDVHQGNGTAVIFQKEPAVFTFSMHGQSNYPFRKEVSDWDIPLPNGTKDEEYLDTLKRALPKLIDRVKPDFIFYLSGVDILETDKLGKLSCTLHGCKARDQLVFEAVQKLGIPTQVSMGGGYSPEIKTIIEAHANTYRTVKGLYF